MKESDGNHFVQRVTFDVELERQSDAKPVQDRLSAMFNNRIEGMLERLLDELDDPNFIVKIDSIEIDLGVISEDELESRLYYKIKETLERKLRKRVVSILSSNYAETSEGAKIPLAPAKIELLTFFLEQGRMPAGGEVFKETIQEIFKELLEDYPEEVKKVLNKIMPAKATVARRIVRQFERETIRSLIQLIAPAHVFYIQSQEQEIVDRSVELFDYGRSTVREEAKIALLKYLFQPEQRFSIPSYQKEMQKLLAERFGSPMATILEKSGSQDSSAEEERQTARETTKSLRYRALIVRAMKRGVNSVSRHDLFEAWEYLIRNEPETLRTAIGSVGESPTPLLRILEELPVPAIRQMIQNVVTQASDTVLEVVVAVIAAHAELKRGNVADEQFVRVVYAALIHELSVEGRIGLAQEAIAEAVRKNLREIPEAPTELLDRWYELEIPGVRTPEQKKEDERKASIEEAKQKAKAEQEELQMKEILAQKELRTEIRRQAANAQEEEEIAALIAKEKKTEDSIDLPERIRRAKAKLLEQRKQKQAEEEEKRSRGETTEDEKEIEKKKQIEKEAAGDEGDEADKKIEGEVTNEEEQRRREAEIDKGITADEMGKKVSGDVPDEEDKRTPEEREKEIEAEKRAAAQGSEEDSETIQKPEIDPDWPIPVSKKEVQDEIAAAREAAKKDGGILDARSLDNREIGLPESLFAENDVEEKRRIGLGEPQDLTQNFDLATESARIEYIMYFFRYGTDPWWVRNLRRRDIEILVGRLTKSEPKALAEATRELIFKTPTSDYPNVAGRIIENLEEVTRLQYMEKIVPDLVGFLGTTTRALLLYFEAKESAISPPANMASPQTFAWQLPLQYVFQYYSSRPSATEMLRFVLKETAAALSIELSEFVKEMDEIAETALENGERRFGPFRRLLPEPDQEIDLPLPQFHPGAPEAIEPESPEARQQRELAEEEEVQRIARQKSEGEETVPESKDLSNISEQEDEATISVGKEDPDLPDANVLDPTVTKPEDSDPTRKPEDVLEEGESSSPKDTKADQEEVSTEKKDVLSSKPEEEGQAKEGDHVAGAEEELAKGQKQESPDSPESEAKKGSEEAEDTEAESKAKEQEEKKRKAEERKTIPGETPEEAEIRLAEERESIARESKGDWPGEETPEVEPLLVTVSELLESEAESVRIIEYYLRYGALPHQESEKLSQEVFQKFVLEVMVRHERAYVRMVRNISDNLKVRLRLVSLGEEVAVQSMLHLNWMAGSPMQPFLSAILELIKTSGAPVESDPVMEHAIFYVTSNSGASFKAVDYVKALFRYLERYYKVSQFDLVQWLIRKNDENSVSVKAILNEILEMIRLAEDRRQVKKKPAKPEEPRYGSAGIPEDVEIFVENAGAVLVWPFLYQYFQRLDLMTEERMFKDEEAMEKGAHMLQYMITLEQNAAEEKLFLNKLIVGLPLDYPMHLEVEITDEEKEMTDSLLRSIADQWSMMKGAPPEQLRATFLVRDGIIKKDDENWLLQVEKKGFDLVLRRLPWGLSQIRVPWLEYMINVEWG